MKGVQSIVCACIISWAWLLPAEADEFHPVVSIGYDFGGDKLHDVYILPINNPTIIHDEITVGKGLTVSAGVYLPVLDGVGIQATVGLKTYSVSGDDLYVDFTRIPYDLLMYLHLTDHHNIALGATYHTSVSTTCTSTNPVNVGCNFKDTFDNAWGTSAEYLYSVHDGADAGLKIGLRYTQIQYVHPLYGTFDGSSTGLILYVN